MKIARVEYERLELVLTEPYTIAYETISKTTNFVLKLVTDTGLVGYGCAAPDLMVIGEEARDVEREIRNEVIPILSGRSLETPSLIFHEVQEVFSSSTSTQAMIDIALHDLLARKAGMPLYRYLGGNRNHIPTSITIGILTPKETLTQAKKYIAEGFYILKIKGGIDLDTDIEKMKMLRDVFPKVKLRFDGNQGYSVDQAIEFAKATTSLGIQFMEQPTEATQLEQLKAVTRAVEIPVMVDEAVTNRNQLESVISNKASDLVNIKLMKVGGLSEANVMCTMAATAGMASMIGSMDECALGIAAGLHFALSNTNVAYADLDGHWDLKDDPYDSLVRFKKGHLYPANGDGLGRITW